MGSIPIFTLADIINWGWLRIGPPYIYINIDPVIVHIGPLALRWYGLMYVVAIVMALWGIQGYARRKGITSEMINHFLWWCIVAGLIGGRLYFVIQQPDLVSYYLAQPWHILATWEGGMAFFGAIFLTIPVLFWRARVARINPLVAIDMGVLFAAIGQIFGRVGNLINGDIIGYRSTLPWSTVYLHPSSWACLRPETCQVPVQPAAGYEMLANIVLLSLMFFLTYRLRRPGTLTLVYLFGYTITQFLVFFTRDNIIIGFLGLNWGLKQAQWTSLVLMVALLPISYLVLRYSKPVPASEVAATYGIRQKSQPEVIEAANAGENEYANDIRDSKDAGDAMEHPVEPGSNGAHQEADQLTHAPEPQREAIETTTSDEPDAHTTEVTENEQADMELKTPEVEEEHERSSP